MSTLEIKDLQVSVDDAKLLAGAHPGATLALVEGVNHVLKIAPADPMANMATYSNASLPIAAAVVRPIVAFVKGQ